MKRMISMLVACLLVVLCFAACQSATPGTTSGSAESTPAAPETTAPIQTVPVAPTQSNTAVEPTHTIADGSLLPLPQQTMELWFSSGVGGWGTQLTLNADGSFTGQFHDSEMGATGEDYPDGTVYICNFSGKFECIEQQNDYSYAMYLAELQLEYTEGEEWIEDSVRYVASGPYGIEGSTEFVFYLPNTPVATLSEDFLSWWPYRFEQNDNPVDSLGYYAILNLTTQDGFFGK